MHYDQSLLSDIIEPLGKLYHANKVNRGLLIITLGNN